MEITAHEHARKGPSVDGATRMPKKQPCGKVPLSRLLTERQSIVICVQESPTRQPLSVTSSGQGPVVLHQQKVMCDVAKSDV